MTHSFVHSPPVALTIAGSDPSGGAGIQADLKTFHALGVYGTACITALTSQNTQGVRGVHSIPGAFLTDQVEAVIDDLPVAATKIGMLGTADVIEALAQLIESRRAEFGTLVLDPVMVATSGDALLDPEAEHLLRNRLVPLADLITPNLPEAARLLGPEVASAQTLDEARSQAAALLELDPRAVLLTGGHLEGPDPSAGEPQVEDIYASGEGDVVLGEVRVRTRNTHGTGCTLSSAIAAHAARAGGAEDDAAMRHAVRAAKRYLTAALEGSADWRLSRTPDTGHGPANHLATTLR